ncbi:MAG: IS21-like element helper ATPase IstB [Candidatus Cloacimonadota bacterium]|nr:IS21-like element helper ATPase IstB [Candidatus Cloacimonadota bacterium]
MRDATTLPLLLKQLYLATMYKNWESLAQEAQEHHWTYPRYLAALSEQEIAARYNKRIKRYTKDSKLPSGKSLATFDFSITKSINQAQIGALAENISWIKNAENVVIFGPSGVGKSHLASAIGHAMIAQGIRTLFTSTTALVQKLQAAKNEYKLPEALNKLSRFPLLILDDIGYVKKDEHETSVLFELIANRYESESLIITANQPFSEWDSIFPDNMMAVAAIDRLIHHSVIINIKEQSYRKNQAEKKSKTKR